MRDQFEQRRMTLFTDATTVVVHLQHMFIIDMHGEEVRIGEFGLAMGTLGVDLFERRIGVRLELLVAIGLLLLIEVLTQMVGQLNVILEQEIFAHGTLEELGSCE